MILSKLYHHSNLPLQGIYFQLIIRGNTRNIRLNGYHCVDSTYRYYFEISACLDRESTEVAALDAWKPRQDSHSRSRTEDGI